MGKKKATTVYFEPELYKQLELYKILNSEFTSVNSVIEKAVEEYLKDFKFEIKEVKK